MKFGLLNHPLPPPEAWKDRGQIGPGSDEILESHSNNRTWGVQSSPGWRWEKQRIPDEFSKSLDNNRGEEGSCRLPPVLLFGPKNALKGSLSLLGYGVLDYDAFSRLLSYPLRRTAEYSAVGEPLLCISSRHEYGIPPPKSAQRETSFRSVEICDTNSFTSKSSSDKSQRPFIHAMHVVADPCSILSYPIHPTLLPLDWCIEKSVKPRGIIPPAHSNQSCSRKGRLGCAGFS